MRRGGGGGIGGGVEGAPNFHTFAACIASLQPSAHGMLQPHWARPSAVVIQSHTTRLHSNICLYFCVAFWCSLELPAGIAQDEVKFAVGSWHIKPHVPRCNIVYNAKYMMGAADAYGDNIEEYWSEMKKFWDASAYMSPAMRQDFLTLMNDLRELDKEEALTKMQAERLRRTLVALAITAEALRTEFHLDPLLLLPEPLPAAARADQPPDELMQVEDGVTVPRSLSKKHQYVQLLQNFQALRPILMPESGEPSGSTTHRQLQLIHEAEEVQQRMALLEEQLGYTWSFEHPDFQHAALELKAYNVARLQRQISAAVAGHAQAQAASTQARDKKSRVRERNKAIKHAANVESLLLQVGFKSRCEERHCARPRSGTAAGVAYRDLALLFGWVWLSRARSRNVVVPHTHSCLQSTFSSSLSASSFH